MKRFTVSAILVLTMSLGPALRAASGQLVQAPLDELRRVAEQRERELAEAQVAADEARARLARAEGRHELAATEWRKVLRYREQERDRVRTLAAQGRICTSGPIVEADGAVAIGRVWLADLEGDRQALAVELPKAITYFEWRARYFQSLRQKHVIREEEARAVLRENDEQLHWTRTRLKALKEG